MKFADRGLSLLTRCNPHQLVDLNIVSLFAPYCIGGMLPRVPFQSGSPPLSACLRRAERPRLHLRGLKNTLLHKWFVRGRVIGKDGEQQRRIQNI
jgi:hypothetical protein